MPTRITVLLQVTTAPTDRSAASQHTGGWSESFWFDGPFTAAQLTASGLMAARRLLLPTQASIVGFRLATYTISGNRISPSGSSTGKIQLAGGSNLNTDLPQVALEMSGRGAGNPNQSRFVLRCIPDLMMEFGEYQPSAPFKGFVTQFCNALKALPFAFLGRDLLQPTLRIQSIAGTAVTMNASLGWPIGAYVRFNRCRDNNGGAVTGSYPIMPASSGFTLVLGGGFPGTTLTTARGTLRLDIIKLINFADVVPNRAVIKKVGRPFEAYRGRQSKRTA